jgi:uncharacterized RDD family membrane protein YckC
MVATPLNCYPENMSFENMSAASAQPTEYRFASFQHRLGSYALDWGLALLTLGIGWLIWSFIVWPEGQTPAKKILKLRTINVVTKQPATWGHMSIREILIPLTVAIASGITGGVVWGAWIAVEICFYFLKGKRTLRDYWVKTVVVNEA